MLGRRARTPTTRVACTSTLGLPVGVGTRASSHPHRGLCIMRHAPRIRMHPRPEPHRFDLTQMEQCMGGALPNYAYDHDKYGDRMHEYDKEVAAELDKLSGRMCAAAHAADHHEQHEHAIQGIAEATEKLSVTVTAT